MEKFGAGEVDLLKGCLFQFAVREEGHVELCEGESRVLPERIGKIPVAVGAFLQTNGEKGTAAEVTAVPLAVAHDAGIEIAAVEAAV